MQSILKLIRDMIDVIIRLTSKQEPAPEQTPTIVDEIGVHDERIERASAATAALPEADGKKVADAIGTEAKKTRTLRNKRNVEDAEKRLRDTARPPKKTKSQKNETIEKAVKQRRSRKKEG